MTLSVNEFYEKAIKACKVPRKHEKIFCPKNDKFDREAAD